MGVVIVLHGVQNLCFFDLRKFIRQSLTILTDCALSRGRPAPTSNRPPHKGKLHCDASRLSTASAAAAGLAPECATVARRLYAVFQNHGAQPSRNLD